MKKFMIWMGIASWLLLCGAAPALATEWLVCDLPAASENITQYFVWVDDNAAIVVPYAEIQGSAKLLDVTDIQNATITVRAVDDQGRVSDASTPFVLRPRPSAPSGFRMVVE